MKQANILLLVGLICISVSCQQTPVEYILDGGFIPPPPPIRYYTIPDEGGVLGGTTPIQIVFWEPMEIESIVLDGDLGALAGNSFLSIDKTILTIQPKNTWQEGDAQELITCIIFANGSVLDHTLTFTVDRTSPSFSSINPPSGSSISVNQAIEVIFEESMDPESFVLEGTLVDSDMTPIWSTTYVANDTLRLDPLLAGVEWNRGTASARIRCNDTVGNPTFINNLIYGVQTLYVKVNGNGNGTINAPMGDINQAIRYADHTWEDSSWIYIAEGEYFVNSRENKDYIQLIQDVSLFGGFSKDDWLKYDPSTYPTSITDIATTGGTVLDPNCVIYGSDIPITTIVDGFILKGSMGNQSTVFYLTDKSTVSIQATKIQNGDATISYGIYNYYASPRVRGNEFSGGVQSDTSTGIYNYRSSATIQQNSFFLGSASCIQSYGVYNEFSFPAISSNEFRTSNDSQDNWFIYNMTSSPTIRDNELICTESSRSTSCNGIMLMDMSFGLVQDNRIQAGTGNGTNDFIGIQIENQSECMITDNEIHAGVNYKNSTAILISHSSPLIDGNIISGFNNIQANALGIMFNYTGKPEVRNNSITMEAGSGIRVYSNTNPGEGTGAPWIHGNTITGCSRCIDYHIEHGSPEAFLSKIHDNQLYAQTKGIEIELYMDNQVDYGYDFEIFDNIIDVIGQGITTKGIDYEYSNDQDSEDADGDLYIYDNTISVDGIQRGIGIDLDYNHDGDDCDNDVSIERNVIVVGDSSEYTRGINFFVEMECNTITNPYNDLEGLIGQNIIVAGQAPIAYGINFYLDEVDGKNTNAIIVEVFSNTIYADGTFSSPIYIEYIDQEDVGNDHELEIEDNILISSDSAQSYGVYEEYMDGTEDLYDNCFFQCQQALYRHDTLGNYTDISDINNWSWSSGNVDLIPVFVDLAGYDFHLTATCPEEIKTGATSQFSVDLDKNPRTIVNGNSMGAYECDL